MMKKFIILAIVFVILGVYFVHAAEVVGTSESTVCCEKTNSGLACQDVPEADCAAGSRKVPTACSSTPFCKPGFCYDSVEGECHDHVPQTVCNAQNNGTWSASEPAQCGLGCCILGDQASFVTLVRCKRLSSVYDLETNYNPSITNEVQCVLSARAEEKGACVFMKDFEKTCRFVKRSECTDNILTANTGSSASSASGTTSNVGQASDLGLTPATTSNQAAGVPGAATTTTGTTTSTTTSGTTGTSGTTTGTTGTTTTGTGTTTTTTGSVISGFATSNGTDYNSTITGANVQFFPGKLCSDEELGTNCGPTTKTMCMDGMEEVYFVDTCGNPANIYDASKVNDKTYWANIVDKPKACGANSASINSATCGNCNYLLGSFCRDMSTAGGVKPKYGTNVCADLNCVDAQGKKRLHGESWCGFDGKSDFTVNTPQASAVAGFVQSVIGSGSAGQISNALGGVAGAAGAIDPVGSKYYRYLCLNGEVVVEPCAEYRQEECIQDSIQTPIGPYSQAACRVNRWQDCTSITNAADCLNTDKRDCTWMSGIEYVLMGGATNGSTMDMASLAEVKKKLESEFQSMDAVGACVPKNAPGLNFWEDGDAKGICAQANAVCPVTYEKRLTGGDWTCVKNCECLDQTVELKRAALCSSLGDCGLKTNILGQVGAKQGYAVKISKMDSSSSSSSSSGGLLG